MASTSTNKQPLLIDRVFNEVINTDNLYSGNANATEIDITGTNSAAVLVNCTTNDGGIVEDLYAISRGTAATILFYFSSAIDYLRVDQSVFIGSINVTSTTPGTYTNVSALPRVLAPVPQQQVAVAGATGATGPYAGEPLRNQALYIPTGKALWVTVRSAGTVSKAPIVGAQGGFY